MKSSALRISNPFHLKRVITLVLLCVVFVACGSNEETTQTTVSEVANSQSVTVEDVSHASGFSPLENGWSFPNYAPKRNNAFTLEDAITLFDRDVICDDSEQGCVATPATVEWINFVNNASQGGVCEGMTVLGVARFLRDELPLSADIALTSELSTSINRLFATQFLDETIQETAVWQKKDVRQIVEELIAAFSDPESEQYTLGIYSDGYGHSVLPYAVDISSDGSGSIWVYDPNWPNQERYIDVEIANNSWRYAYFGADQEVDRQKWQGTGDTLDLTPLSVRKGPFTVPFAHQQAKAKNYLAITSVDNQWALRTSEGVVLNGSELSDNSPLVTYVYRSQNPLGNTEQGFRTIFLEWVGDFEFSVQSDQTWIRAFSSEGTSVVGINGEASGEFNFLESGNLEILLGVEGDTEAEMRLSNEKDRFLLNVDSFSTNKLSLSAESVVIQIMDQDDVFFELIVPSENRRRDLSLDKERNLLELQPMQLGNVGDQQTPTPSVELEDEARPTPTPVVTPTPVPRPTPTATATKPSSSTS